MAVGRDMQDVLLAMNLQDVTKFVLEPALRYDNLLASMMPQLYTLYPRVKNEIKMQALQKPKNILQPKQGCDVWKPQGKIKSRKDKITVCGFELMSEMCADEFDYGCLRNLQAAGNRVNSMSASPDLTAIQNAILNLIREGMSDDIFKINWFGDSDFGTVNTPWHEDLAGLPADEVAEITAMLQHCNGWWAEILERVQLSGEEQVVYVDSNDGTLAGNGTLPQNVVGFLREMRTQSKQILKYWNYNRTGMRPVYLVQDVFYQAYREYLTSLGQERAFMYLVDGVPVEGVLMLDGFPVISMPEFDMYDNEVGATGKNARAIFTALGNLSFAFDADTLNSSDYSLLVQESPLLKDKNKVWMYNAMKLGTGIEVPNLMTVAYNSSTTFVTA